jgi:DNA replication and repair protein RecF
MHLTQLSLTHFRNFKRQTFDFAPGMVLLLGENAQGKTNVLEAALMLATGRSERSATDADLIAWEQREEDQPFAQIACKALRAGREIGLEITIAGRRGASGKLVASKRFRLNGTPKRATDVVGAFLAVMFTTDDMDLVRGAPAERRRFLDVMLSQADRSYVRAFQRYNKVITQRNALLKRIGEGGAKRDELEYWDGELSHDGAAMLRARALALRAISGHAASAHAELSGEREGLEVSYLPRLDEAWDAARIAGSPVEDVALALAERLRATQPRDVGAGLTLSGPHRDDVALRLGGEPAASFASRGQQRTAALALRLAEARFLRDSSGEQPVLLLDDVLSELDEHRRLSVLRAIEAEQVIITSADPDRFPEGLVHASQVWRIKQGTGSRLS